MNSVIEKLFSHKSVSLLGAGVSNMPLASLLSPICSSLTVRDKKSPEELGENAQKLVSLGAKLITGDDYLKNIDEDIVFRSPGIRPDIDELNKARERGSLVTSEMELFFRFCPAKRIAVTGSDELKKEVQDYVKKRTAPYKYPRIVEFREELPKTTSGKIQRNKL